MVNERQQGVPALSNHSGVDGPGEPTGELAAEDRRLLLRFVLKTLLFVVCVPVWLVFWIIVDDNTKPFDLWFQNWRAAMVIAVVVSVVLSLSLSLAGG